MSTRAPDLFRTTPLRESIALAGGTQGQSGQALDRAVDTGRNRRKVSWFIGLMAAVCFEGLGRKFLPFVPSVLFYFLKDVVLVAGLVLFGVPRLVTASARRLYSPFMPVLALAIAWTLVQMFNPEQRSILLALTGIRSYWLWWVGPLIVASAVRNPDPRRGGTVVLAAMGIFIAGYAWLQFNSPALAAINTTTFFGGEARTGVALVTTTGRVRVSSTFAYLAGFADFGALFPAVLLGLAVDARDRLARTLSVVAAVVVVATVGMTGSRMGVGLSLVGVGTVLLTSGFIRTRAGRWAVGLAIISAIAVASVGEQAFGGVLDRWRGEDTASRLSDVLLILPPIALTEIEYPPLGIGTGMQQNARFQLDAASTWDSEEEPGRYLVELGIPGYLLVWLARLGLLFALLKMARTLRQNGRRGAASAALAYGVLTMFGRLTFDHVWQALYFTGVGLLLGQYVDVIEARIRTSSSSGAKAG